MNSHTQNPIILQIRKAELMLYVFILLLLKFKQAIEASYLMNLLLFGEQLLANFHNYEFLTKL